MGDACLTSVDVGETMHAATSKLTKKYQVTVPEPVRRKLFLKAGDAIAFDIEGDQVHLRKVPPMDILFTESLNETLSEWTSPADEDADFDL